MGNTNNKIWLTVLVIFEVSGKIDVEFNGL